MDELQAYMMSLHELRGVLNPTKEAVMVQTALAFAGLGTCPRQHTGAVTCDLDYQVITTAYNGAPRNQPHCAAEGCVIVAGSCVRAAHAEANAIFQCAAVGRAVAGGMMYSTHRPCVRCAVAIVQARIRVVRYVLPYEGDSAELAIEVLARAGVLVAPIKYQGVL